MVRSHNEDSIAADAGERAGRARRRHGRLQRRRGRERHRDHRDHDRAAAARSRRRRRTRSSRRRASRSPSALLREQIAKANTSIFQAAQSQPQYAGMGTTLVVALFYDNKRVVAHIGDSRLYRLRGETFEQVTRDHSLLQEQIDSGMITPEQAKLSQNKNLVTRALGIDPRSSPRSTSTRPSRRHLPAVLGRAERHGERRGHRHDAARRCQANLQLAAQQLVQMANDNGGRDNVSVILVRVVRGLRCAARAGSRGSSAGSDKQRSRVHGHGES